MRCISFLICTLFVITFLYEHLLVPGCLNQDLFTCIPASRVQAWSSTIGILVYLEFTGWTKFGTAVIADNYFDSIIYSVMMNGLINRRHPYLLRWWSRGRCVFGAAGTSGIVIGWSSIWNGILRTFFLRGLFILAIVIKIFLCFCYFFLVFFITFFYIFLISLFLVFFFLFCLFGLLCPAALWYLRQVQCHKQPELTEEKILRSENRSE